jgi:hypothetical protein
MKRTLLAIAFTGILFLLFSCREEIKVETEGLEKKENKKIKDTG